MTSADFLAHRNRIYSKTSPGKSIFLHPIPDTSTHRKSPFRCISVRLLTSDVVLLWILILFFVPLMYFCSSVPDFAGSLPSLHGSPQTSLRLATLRVVTPCDGTYTRWKLIYNTLLQFSNKICIFRILLELSLACCSAHAGHTQQISSSRGFVLRWTEKW
jgi:hypothetical protein